MRTQKMGDIRIKYNARSSIIFIFTFLRKKPYINTKIGVVFRMTLIEIIYLMVIARSIGGIDNIYCICEESGPCLLIFPVKVGH